MLELIYQVLSISECFGKTLVAFDFEEKLTQSVAKITMCQIAQKNKCHVSEDFLRLHFAVDQFQDMIWKTEKYRVSKNT